MKMNASYHFDIIPESVAILPALFCFTVYRFGTEGTTRLSYSIPQRQSQYMDTVH